MELVLQSEGEGDLPNDSYHANGEHQLSHRIVIEREVNGQWRDHGGDRSARIVKVELRAVDAHVCLDLCLEGRGHIRSKLAVKI